MWYFYASINHFCYCLLATYSYLLLYIYNFQVNTFDYFHHFSCVTVFNAFNYSSRDIRKLKTRLPIKAVAHSILKYQFVQIHACIIWTQIHKLLTKVDIIFHLPINNMNPKIIIFNFKINHYVYWHWLISSSCSNQSKYE